MTIVSMTFSRRGITLSDPNFLSFLFSYIQGNSVDMESLTKYVINSGNRLPSYCFAEENLVIDSYSKSTTTEEFNESSKVSPGPNFAYRDNNQQFRSVPPGFVPINEHVDRFNTQTNLYYGYSSVESNASTKAPSLFSDLIEDVSSSPFLDKNMKSSVTNLTSDILSSDVEKQMFLQFMEESTTLQMQLTKSFRPLLNFLPKTKNTCIDYIKFLFQFNNNLKVLVKELNSRSANVIPNTSQNNENDAGLSSRTYNYSPNCKSPVKETQDQETASSLRPPPLSTTTSSIVNSFGEYHGQYHHAAFPISHTKDFPHSSQHQVHTHNPHNSQFQAHAHNFGQSANQAFVSSHQADVNGPYVQTPFITSSDLKSSVLSQHGNIAKNTSALENIPSGKTPSLSNDLRNDVTNNLFLDANLNPSAMNATSLPTSSEILSNDAEKQTLAQLYIDKLLHKSTLNTITTSHSNTANPSSCRQSANEFVNVNLQHGNIYKNQEPTKWKETNPFISHQNVEGQAEQNNSYDMTNLVLYLPNTNQQSYTPTINENANARAVDYNFYGNIAESEPNVNFVSTGYRMYEDAKMNSDGNYTPKIIYEAGPVMYNLQKKPEEQQLPSQSATQLQSNIVNNNDVNHVALSSSSIDKFVLNDEGYITPTYNPSPVINTEVHYQSDVLSQHILPEAWTNAMIRNNDPLQDYSKSSVSATMCPPTSLLAHKEWNYESNKEFTTGDSYRTAEPCRTPLSDNSEKTMITSTKFWNSSSNKNQKGTFVNCSASLNVSFLFKKIGTCNTAELTIHRSNK